MSWLTLLVPVFTSIRWAQARVIASPWWLQAVVAEVQRRPSRQAASSKRHSIYEEGGVIRLEHVLRRVFLRKDAQVDG